MAFSNILLTKSRTEIGLKLPLHVERPFLNNGTTLATLRLLRKTPDTTHKLMNFDNTGARA